MKIKTGKKKSCYIMTAMILSSSLFLTGMTGCKDREAEFLIEDSQETETEKEASGKNTDKTDEQKSGDSESDKADDDSSDVVDTEKSSDTDKAGEETEEISDVKQPETIYVDVCGAVVNPGVFELEAGSRVFQAIEAAGGYLPEAVPGCVNRAGVLADGQQLYILTQEEMEQQGLSQAELANATGASDGGNTGNAGAGTTVGTASSAQQDSRININTADETQLTTLTGIGAARAQAIIAYRQENGPFAAIEDIMNVQGIKEGTFAKIKDKIVVG